MNNFYDNEKLEQLKAKSAFSMPDNPSNRGWSASQIKRTLYEPSLMLFEWAKENGVISEERYLELKTQIDTNTIDIETLKTQVDEILNRDSLDIIDLKPYWNTKQYISVEQLNEILKSDFPILRYENSTYLIAYVEEPLMTFVSNGGIDNFKVATINKSDRTISFTGVLLPTGLRYKRNRLYLEAMNRTYGTFVDVKTINNEPILGVDGNIDLVQASEKAVPNGIATLGSDGKVLPAQLPDGIDEIIEGTLTSPIAFTDDKGKVWTTGTPDITHRIFVDTNTNKSYRWSGSQFTAIADDLSLGYTHETAFYGDEGKRNSDDIVSLKSQVNGNNFVRTTTQTLTKEQQDIVKTNLNVIEAGITASDDGNGTVNILNGGDPLLITPNNGQPTTDSLGTLQIGNVNYSLSVDWNKPYAVAEPTRNNIIVWDKPLVPGVYVVHWKNDSFINTNILSYTGVSGFAGVAYWNFSYDDCYLGCFKIETIDGVQQFRIFKYGGGGVGGTLTDLKIYKIA